MSVNYDRVCRLCLSSRGELLPIFPTTSSDDSDPPVLASKIRDCVSVQISENDDLPTNVCRKCVDNVNNWHIFKSVCERTQNKLELLIKKDVSQLEEIKIKSEPLSDEAYDDGVVIDGSYPHIENAAGSSKVQPEGPPILASLGLTPRSDKKNVDPRLDWQRVHAILDMVQDDDVIDSLQSIEECDVVQQSDHNSDSEADLQMEIDDQYIDCKIGYMCRNQTILSKNPKLSTAAINSKIKDASRLRKKIGTSKLCAQPKKAWQLLFTDDLLDLIVASTNDNILKTGNDITTSTNAGEIKTLIGILYLHGIMRPTHQSVRDLWNKGCGIPCVRSAMKYERFKFLIQNMSFDKDNDDSIIQFDIMKRMRKAFEIFAMNCRTAYEVDNLVVIDEVIVPVYGPCPFRFNIDKKPLKRGLKMVLLVDPASFYISNLDVITDHYFGAEEVVSKMVQHLAGSGRTVMMDSWYTSLDLIDKLKREYQLFSIASAHPSDDIIPPLFVSQYRKCKTFLTGFLDSDVAMTSYMNSKKKSLNVLTNEPKFYKRGHKNHSTVAALYRKNQSAVEVIDVLMHYYTTMQHTNDWTLSLFFTLLNIAAVNAQVIWSSQNLHQVQKRRTFINELACSLLECEESISDVCLTDVSLLREKFAPLKDVSYKNRRRCRICVKTTKRDRRTKQFCLKCGQFICKEHTVNFCTMCSAG